MTYVRPGLPPIIMIHGDHDPTVPYSQSVDLSAALTKVGVPNQLVTIPGGRHGSFSNEDEVGAYNKIWDFLRSNVPSLATAVPAQ